eukprot:1646490-Rhodomonas_salina.1
MDYLQPRCQQPPAPGELVEVDDDDVVKSHSEPRQDARHLRTESYLSLLVESGQGHVEHRGCDLQGYAEVGSSGPGGRESSIIDAPVRCEHNSHDPSLSDAGVEHHPVIDLLDKETLEVQRHLARPRRSNRPLTVARRLVVRPAAPILQYPCAFVKRLAGAAAHAWRRGGVGHYRLEQNVRQRAELAVRSALQVPQELRRARQQHCFCRGNVRLRREAVDPSVHLHPCGQQPPLRLELEHVEEDDVGGTYAEVG